MLKIGLRGRMLLTLLEIHAEFSTVPYNGSSIQGNTGGQSTQPESESTTKLNPHMNRCLNCLNHHIWLHYYIYKKGSSVATREAILSFQTQDHECLCSYFLYYWPSAPDRGAERVQLYEFSYTSHVPSHYSTLTNRMPFMWSRGKPSRTDFNTFSSSGCSNSSQLSYAE